MAWTNSDGQRHNIIRPIWRRAYKNWNCDLELYLMAHPSWPIGRLKIFSNTIQLKLIMCNRYCRNLRLANIYSQQIDTTFHAITHFPILFQKTKCSQLFHLHQITSALSAYCIMTPTVLTVVDEIHQCYIFDFLKLPMFIPWREFCW
jgi:VanZ family protein